MSASSLPASPTPRWLTGTEVLVTQAVACPSDPECGHARHTVPRGRGQLGSHVARPPSTSGQLHEPVHACSAASPHALSRPGPGCKL